MQAIELYLDGVQIGEIGQEDVFSMEDFERELNATGIPTASTQRVNNLAQFSDPYASATGDASRFFYSNQV